MVFKNVRVCGDCHTAMKYISVARGREIVNVVGKVIGSKDSNLEKSHQTLQPARNPLRLCGICVCIDDRDDCNTSSSTSVPYGVSNLSTISHQQNHQATNSDIEHPKSRPKTVNTSTCKSYLTFDYHSSTQNRRGHYPTSSEAFESLIKETFANAVRLKIALLRPVSRTAGTGNTAIAMGSCYQFSLKRTTTSCYRNHGEKMEGITGMMAQTVGLERSLLFTVIIIHQMKLQFLNEVLLSPNGELAREHSG
ncbi:hypothetical protein Tco_0116999 [Tanacetum coccineum]